MGIHLALLTALVSASISHVKANAFLRPHGVVESEEQAGERVVKALLAELAKGEDGATLHKLEEELRPLFDALPKDMQGKLEPAAVRHALHRYFSQWRGWHMKGLEHGAHEKNTTAVGIVEVFGQGKGTDLSRLALLAAKLTELVHQEAEFNLRNIYGALELPTGELVSKRDAEIVLSKYAVIYILGDSTDQLDQSALIQAERDVVDVFPAWRSAKMWTKDMDRTLQFVQQEQHNPFLETSSFSFEQRLATVQEFGHRFASFQNLECKSLKSAMTETEHQGTGRVLLSDFYSIGLRGDWQFNEKTEYLRSLGALDESDPERLSVYIPNYVLSPTNCLSASGFYTVCCFNECMGLMEHLEHHIKAPTASAARIAQLVEGLESDTVAAPRNLSVALHARLGAIATLHGGDVPLHGRLFAQWMHHAYPRECPFPHLSGSTKPLSQEEWQRRSGDPLATKAEMLRLSTAPEVAREELASLPWVEVEELIAPSQHWRERSLFSKIQWLAMLSVLASMAASLLRSSKSSHGCMMESKPHAHLV